MAGWLLKLNAAKARNQASQALYERSLPIPKDHPVPIQQWLEELCHDLHIPSPELRLCENVPFPMGVPIHKNCILVEKTLADTLPQILQNAPESAKKIQQAIKTFLAHELCHIVYDDVKVGLREERRADRFAHFATGNTEAFIAVLEEINWNTILSKATRPMRTLLRDTKQEDKHIREIERLSHERYGTVEDRIKALNEPLTDREAAAFQKALEVFRTRIHTHSRPPSSPSR